MKFVELTKTAAGNPAAGSTPILVGVDYIVSVEQHTVKSSPQTCVVTLAHLPPIHVIGDFADIKNKLGI